MAFPKGVSRKDYNEWKRKQEFLKKPKEEITIDNYLISVGRSSEVKPKKSAEAEQIVSFEDPMLGKIVTVDKSKLYGISFDPFCTVCWSRDIYKRDTEVESTSGEKHTYKKGEFTHWVKMAAPFKSGEDQIGTAVAWCAMDALKKKLVDAGNMDNIAKQITELRKDFDFKIKKP